MCLYVSSMSAMEMGCESPVGNCMTAVRVKALGGWVNSNPLAGHLDRVTRIGLPRDLAEPDQPNRPARTRTSDDVEYQVGFPNLSLEA